MHTGPQVLLRRPSQPRPHRIPLNITADLTTLPLAANNPIEVLLLPKRARPAQQPVGAKGNWSFHSAHQLRQRDVSRPQHMHVIGHDDISVESAPAVSRCLPPLFHHQERDFRLAQVQRTGAGCVKLPVKSDESLARCEVFTTECAPRRQASMEPPRDEGRPFWSTQMGQPAAIASHPLRVVPPKSLASQSVRGAEAPRWLKAALQP
jgi:hypothetical protein